MPKLQLEHHPDLAYASTRSLPPAACPDAEAETQHGLTLSFRRMPGARQRLTGVTACTRFHERAGPSDISCIGLETDSPLAPLILWDLAHGLSIGASITMRDDGGVRSHLESEYFAASLAVESRTRDAVVFRKTHALPAERGAGLDAWTFGIPAGPGDASILNRVVARILSLDVPHKEILLCGRPGAGFSHWDKVRVIGEDIAAPPVQICAKKNRIAQEAKYPNLCILHDRVMLPIDFYRAVLAFGDLYPLTTLQSLYFDDRLNAAPRRYSDYNQPALDQPLRVGGWAAEGSPPTAFSRASFPSIESHGFLYSNARRHSAHRYATGSLYIAKRDVWLACPQDETLHWSEFEDVEHGRRAAAAGIPSRVNPYALTQSIVGRPLLSLAGSVTVEQADGRRARYRPWAEFLPLPRKPLLRSTHAEALEGLQKFLDKHGTVDRTVRADPRGLRTTRDRMLTLRRALASIECSLQHDKVRELLRDYERWILQDQCAYSWVDHALAQLAMHGAQARLPLLLWNFNLLNQGAQRPWGPLHARTADDYFPRKGFLTAIGTVWSAINLWCTRHRSVYVEGNLLDLIRCIWNSTPFHAGTRDRAS